MVSSTAVFADLFCRRAEGIRPGLERVRRAHAALGCHGLKTPCTLVAGTNGKGSTSGFMYQLLAAPNRRVGLYTSPHLVHFSERIQISDVSIDDLYLQQLWQEIQPTLPAVLEQELTFFEIATLLGFVAFHRQKTDFNIWEVGLGGRLDATNISDPTISVITSIGRDHEDYLGNTLSAIAREKAGVMRSHRPTLLGRGVVENADPGVIQTMRTVAREVGCPLREWGAHFGLQGDQVYILTCGDNERREFPLPESVAQQAPYLRENFALAVAAVESLKFLSWSELLKSMAQLDRPSRPMPPSLWARNQACRIRTLQGETQELRLDVGHNIDGVRRFLEGLPSAAKQPSANPWPALICILRDKQVDAMLDLLRSNLGHVVLFMCQDERSFSASDLAERHGQLPIYANWSDAWNFARVHFPREMPWIVCGSLHAVGEVIGYFEAAPDDTTAKRWLLGREPGAR